LSTHLKEKEEKIERLLESLAEESSKEIPVVVEGKKDVETLRALNVDGKIITLKAGGKSFLNVLSDLERLRVQEVILMLDFDRRGKEATKRLKLSLENMGVTPNLAFWLELFGLVGKEVKDVEGLIKYMETLKRKIGRSTKDRSFYYIADEPFCQDKRKKAGVSSRLLLAVVAAPFLMLSNAQRSVERWACRCSRSW